MKYDKKNFKIKTAIKSEKGFSVSTTDASIFFVDDKYLKGNTPQAGDIITLYTRGFSLIVGMDLNGERLYLKTEEQLEQERKEWQENYEREKQERFEKQKDAMDSRFNALPKLLQHRLAMYRMFDENFRKDEEGYEECAIRIGYKIFLISKSEEDIKKFADLSYEEQIERVPEIASEGMSGNQFGFACYFAKGLLKDSETIDIYNPQVDKLLDSFAMAMPNALAPLSGHRCFPRKEHIQQYINTLV